MKFNQWTLGLAAVGVVSLGSAMQAEEAASQVMTAVSGTTINGYVGTSAIWKFGTGNANLPGRSFDGATKQDGFNVDVVKLTVEKPVTEGEWAAGYKFDLLLGPDAAKFSNLGLGIGSGASGNADANDHWTLENAYVALRAPVGNGLDLKVGAFDTIIGYEVFDAGSNPNYSRSYGYALEPVQHAGVLASYRVNDMISASAGVANSAVGWKNSNAAFAESRKTYMASVTLTAPEALGPVAGSTLYAGIINGTGGSAVNGAVATKSNSTWIYSGATLKTPWEALSLGLAFDYLFDNAGNTVANNSVNWAYAVAGYASYQLTEKLKWNNRVDWTQADDGTYYNSAAAGKENQLIAVTSTFEYALWENVLTRAELRWDHALASGERPFGKAGAGNGDKNALSAGLNFIYKF